MLSQPQAVTDVILRGDSGGFLTAEAGRWLARWCASHHPGNAVS